MSGKKKNKSFQNNPFRDLKGLSVSTPEKEREPVAQEPQKPPEPEGDADFAVEMTRLGVRPAESRNVLTKDETEKSCLLDGEEPDDDDPELDTDEALFLNALNSLNVRFEDGVPEPPESRAIPRRMKQFRQGKLAPEEELDLHGLSRADVASRVGYFLDNAVYHGRKTVLIITGRGLGSRGEPVLRNEVERFLDAEGRKWATEWGRAPRRHGGEGALVVFLKKGEKR